LNPEQILQLLIAGLTVGSIYALIALGFVVIYSVTGVINFAQGDFAMLGALLAITLSGETPLFNRSTVVNLNWPLPLAIVVAALLVAWLGMGLYRFAIRPARTDAVIVQIIITIGAAIALRGVALIVWGTDPYRLPDFTVGPPIKIGRAVLTLQDIWIVGVTLALLVLLYLFFQHTLLGKALRACAINRTAARLMGINVGTMTLLAFALSAGIGALAGIVIAPKTFMSYDTGAFLGLKGFVAAIVGGLENETRAVVGGLLLGLLETLAAGLLSSGYKDAIAFVALFIFLFLQASGIWRRGNSREIAGI
jgi:branched-chain amino acid transport system permease protein